MVEKGIAVPAPMPVPAVGIEDWAGDNAIPNEKGVVVEMDRP
jgi:hypothetical protein